MIGRILSVIVSSIVVGVVGYLLFDRQKVDIPDLPEPGSFALPVMVGSCVDKLGPGERIEIASCSERHEGEAYVSILLAAGPYPGTAALERKADRGCTARLRRRKPDFQGTVGWVTPEEREWTQDDDRTIVCVAVYAKPRTGRVMEPDYGFG